MADRSEERKSSSGERQSFHNEQLSSPAVRKKSSTAGSRSSTASLTSLESRSTDVISPDTPNFPPSPPIPSFSTAEPNHPVFSSPQQDESLPSFPVAEEHLYEEHDDALVNPYEEVPFLLHGPQKIYSPKPVGNAEEQQQVMKK